MPQLNIAITGAGGRVGRLIEKAFERNPEPGLKIWYLSRQARHPDRDDHICWAHDDTRALAQLCARLDGLDCLINLAGPAADALDLELANNTEIALACLRAAVQLKVRHVFFASSAAVYGRPPGGQLLHEDAIPRPVSAYGLAKIEMERAIQHWLRNRRSNAPGITNLRIGNIAGADRLLQNARVSSPERPMRLDRFSDGSSPFRSYIGPQTLARVLAGLCRLAITTGTDLPTVLNVAAPRGVFMADLLGALKEQERLADWCNVPAPADTISAVCLDTGWLEALCDFDHKDSDPQEMVRQWLTLDSGI